MKFRKKLFLLFTFFVVGCEEAEQQTNTQATETSAPKPVGMVVTVNPLATEAGLKILRTGGSAMDAAVAVEATLSLAEPQCSSSYPSLFVL